jgi:hypothetical protein
MIVSIVVDEIVQKNRHRNSTWWIFVNSQPYRYQRNIAHVKYIFGSHEVGHMPRVNCSCWTFGTIYFLVRCCKNDTPIVCTSLYTHTRNQFEKKNGGKLSDFIKVKSLKRYRHAWWGEGQQQRRGPTRSLMRLEMGGQDRDSISCADTSTKSQVGEGRGLAGSTVHPAETTFCLLGANKGMVTQSQHGQTRHISGWANEWLRPKERQSLALISWQKEDTWPIKGRLKLLSLFIA